MQYVTRKTIIRNIVGTVRNKQFQLHSSERCVFLVTKTSDCSEKNNCLYTANCTATEYTICPFAILLISLVFPRYRYTERYSLILNKIEYLLTCSTTMCKSIFIPNFKLRTNRFYFLYLSTPTDVYTIVIKLYGYARFNFSLKVSRALQTKLTEISVTRYFHVTIIFIGKIRKCVRKKYKKERSLLNLRINFH